MTCPYCETMTDCYVTLLEVGDSVVLPGGNDAGTVTDVDSRGTLTVLLDSGQTLRVNACEAEKA